VTEEESKDWIKKCEGFRDKLYFDEEGIPTIGWGRNLSHNGITKSEADILFENDYSKAAKDLSPFYWYMIQPMQVKYALINMCFNLGIGGLLEFRKMIAALSVKNYTQAAIEALNSKWADQVGNRAKDIAVMIREAK
jgi:lysozyme